MSTFQEFLTQANPAITAAAASELRACLVAHAIDLHDAEEVALGRSLRDWWQWIEEEGFDQALLATTLGQFCSGRIGDQDFHALQAHVQAMADEPEGLPALMEWLEQTHPGLFEAMEQAEGLALKEDVDLQARAGGTGKAGTWMKHNPGWTTVGVVVAVSGMSGGYLYYRAKKLAKQKAAEQLELEKRQVRDQLTAKREAELNEFVVQSDKELRAATPDQKRDWIRANLYPTEKNLLRFEERDIVGYADALTAEHLYTNEPLFRDALAKALRKEMPAVYKELRGSAEYANKLKEFQGNETYFTGDKSRALFEKDGGWFRDQIKILGTEKKAQIGKQISADLRQAYEGKIRQAIDERKAALGDRLEARGEREMDAMFDAAEIKVDRDIIDLTRSAERKVEKAIVAGEDTLIKVERAEGDL